MSIRRFSLHASRSRRLMRRPPGGAATRVDLEARALMDRMAELSAQLRSDCGSFDYLGDSAACSNSADEIDVFLADRGPRQLAQSEAGDNGAHQRLVDFGHKMLDFLRTAYDDISAGDTFADVAQSVEQTIADDAAAAGRAAKFSLPWVALAAAAVAGVVVIGKVT